jgi:hypothetical protein
MVDRKLGQAGYDDDNDGPVSTRGRKHCLPDDWGGRQRRVAPRHRGEVLPQARGAEDADLGPLAVARGLHPRQPNSDAALTSDPSDSCPHARRPMRLVLGTSASGV